MTDHPTLRAIDRATRCLLDPEQTAVAPDLAGPLRLTLENTLSHTPGVRDLALAILEHEHTRVTAEPKNEPSDAATLLDTLATSFGQGAVPGMDPESEDAAFQYLIQLRDDVRAGRQL